MLIDVFQFLEYGSNWSLWWLLWRLGGRLQALQHIAWTKSLSSVAWRSVDDLNADLRPAVAFGRPFCFWFFSWFFDLFPCAGLRCELVCRSLRRRGLINSKVAYS
uniref:Uncharacterized protein n=1 Tax=Physcomitrium patens TaxID=3218 RepID=A0A2K1KI28_PHYPA|nr:hypothetical protein PHYPA_007107 [Physcomitrium patens]